MKEEFPYTPLYYGTPCQVKFLDCGDLDNITTCYGIAIEDRIICGCCGAIFLIEDVVKDAEKANIHCDDAIVELEWVNISEAIKGE